MPEVLAVSVGQPRAIPVLDAHGREHTIVTAIYKTPVNGRVHARLWGLEGDGQADTRVVKGNQVHGGAEKALYLYPFEHYALWQAELGKELEFGQFGENLTVTGLLEGQVRTGDRLRVGEAVLQVTTPRGPCFKFDARMGIPDAKERMNENCRTGFYVRVLKEGTIGAGDAIEFVPASPAGPTILELHVASL